MNKEITSVTQITVTDPDTKLGVDVSIFKDAESGGMFGVDSSFLSNTDEPVYNPFTGRHTPVDDDDASTVWTLVVDAHPAHGSFVWFQVGNHVKPGVFIDTAIGAPRFVAAPGLTAAASTSYAAGEVACWTANDRPAPQPVTYTANEKLAREFQLLRVTYGTDCGLVSLKYKVVMAQTDASMNLYTHHSVPTVEVTDLTMNDRFGDEHNWADLIEWLVTDYDYDRKLMTVGV